MAAPRALIQMPAQLGGAAALDGSQRLDMLGREPARAALEECPPRGADQIGHLQGWPLHLAGWSGCVVRIVGERQRIERTGGGLQMPLRQMQVHRGRLQVTVAQQKLDGAQVGAGL